MSLPFDAKRVRAYAVELGAGGQRLGCEFSLDDGSVVFVDDSQITPEIERIISSMGSPSARLRHGTDIKKIATAEVVLKDFDGTKTIYPATMPLPELLSNSDTDDGILIIRSYARTEERDESGRTVYIQRN
jgi:hypothetical protein